MGVKKTGSSWSTLFRRQQIPPLLFHQGYCRSIFPSRLLTPAFQLSARISRSRATLNSCSCSLKCKFTESDRSLNLKKCRILVHLDSAHLIVWSPTGRPGICAAIPIATDCAKLLGAPIGTEPFRTNFIARRLSKTTSSVAAVQRLPPSATWTVLRVGLPSFPLVQESLANIDTIIDPASSAPRCGFTTGASSRPPDAPHRAYTLLPPYEIGWVR